MVHPIVAVAAQRCCMKIFALTVTGDINPNESNISEDSRRISHLVTKVLWVGIVVSRRGFKYVPLHA